nr:excisionase family DNA-binding protein [Nocardia wallacei]
MSDSGREKRPAQAHSTSTTGKRKEDRSGRERPSRYVSIGAAAERASVSKDTIRRMIADGSLPAYRFRGQIRIAVEDIDRAMRPLR